MSYNSTDNTFPPADIPPPSYKIVLLGDSSVGKTSLVHRFTNNSFDQHTSNTIGAAFITKELQSSKTPIKHLKLEIWDTAGQERYRSLTPMYYRNSKIAIICYDLSNIDDTFEKAKYWINQLNLNSNSGTESDIIRIKLIGNKLDLFEDSSINKDKLDEIDQYCTENQIMSYRSSAQSGENVNLIFNDIIDELPVEYFNKYYETQIQLSNDNGNNNGQLNFLNDRINSVSSGCC